MIRISCADYAWPALSHAVVMSVIKDLGFDGVDVAVFGDTSKVTVTEVGNDPLAAAAKVRRLADRHGLAVADVFLIPDAVDGARMSPTSRHAQDRPRLRKLYGSAVRFAAACGSSGITVLPGMIDDGVERGVALERAAVTLRELVLLASESQLRVSIEPHAGSLTPTPASTVELVDLCPGLTVNLDPAQFAFDGASVEQMLPMTSVTGHLQARFGGPGVMQAVERENTIDYRELIFKLRADGYDGWLASEFVWMSKWGCDRVDNTSESKAMHDYLRRILAELPS